MTAKAKLAGAAMTAAEATPEGRAATVAAGAAGKAKGSKGGGGGSSPGSSGAGSKSSGSKSSSSGGKAKSGGRRAVRFALGRKALLAEFIACLLLLGLSGITGTVTGSDGIEQTGSRLAIKGSALAGVFVVLGLVAAGGKGAERAAGALGAVITLAYVFQERATFAAVAKWAGTQAKEPTT